MRSNLQGRRVQRGEWPALLVSQAYFFCVLTAYYVVRPVREQFSAAVGSTQLLWFYAATFVATLLLTPVFAWLVSRWPRRIMVPVVYGFFVACLLAFVPLFTHAGLLSPRDLGVVFFVWVSVFNLFVVSVFWIFMSDIWDPAQARRLFPIIAFAGTAGAIAGPAITRSLVGVIGVAPLLGVSATLLGVAAVCAVVLGRWARDSFPASHDTPLGGGMLDGLRQIIASPFMRSMALLLLLADGIGTINYAMLADYSGATFHDAQTRTAFAATIELLSNGFTMLLQLGVTWWLLPRVGPARILVIWATLGVTALALVVFSPGYTPVAFGLPALAVASVVTRGLGYGMAEPARHSLFTQVPRGERYKGQNAVDTAAWRFGDLTIAFLMNTARATGVGIAGFASMGALAAAAAAMLGWRLSPPVPPETQPARVA